MTMGARCRPGAFPRSPMMRSTPCGDGSDGPSAARSPTSRLPRLMPSATGRTASETATPSGSGTGSRRRPFSSPWIASCPAMWAGFPAFTPCTRGPTSDGVSRSARETGSSGRASCWTSWRSRPPSPGAPSSRRTARPSGIGTARWSAKRIPGVSGPSATPRVSAGSTEARSGRGTRRRRSNGSAGATGRRRSGAARRATGKT